MKPLFVAAGLLGASGVLLGALAAHWLREVFETDPRKGEAFGTAVDYHLLHAVGLLVLSVAVGSKNEVFARRSRKAGWVMVIGICLFCGTIYAWALGGPKWLVHVTPLGGVTLVVSWIMVAWAGLALTRRGNSV
ncbi:DUF423 domain-containing protein [Opitutales bacterium]|jgi:uncharacterized membrane protein YgdD (TMEM256/DUF423 family)|nr:DUF423 domain-containing protein [Opitutales bacterium]